MDTKFHSNSRLPVCHACSPNMTSTLWLKKTGGFLPEPICCPQMDGKIWHPQPDCHCLNQCNQKRAVILQSRKHF